MEGLEKEKKTFKEMISGLKYKPNEQIISKVDLNTHPFRGNKFFSYSPNKLSFEEFKRCLDLFIRRLPEINSTNLNHVDITCLSLYTAVQQEISSIEIEYKEQLEELAIDLITDLYNIPDSIDLKANLSYDIPLDSSKPYNPSRHIKKDSVSEKLNLPEKTKSDFPMGSNKEREAGSKFSINDLSPERKEYLENQIQKRVILNSMVHGSAINIWKGSYYLVKEQLDMLDERLIPLYDKYAAIVSFMLWRFSPDEMNKMINNNTVIKQGVNKVEFFPETNEETSAEVPEDNPSEKEHKEKATTFLDKIREEDGEEEKSQDSSYEEENEEGEYSVTNAGISAYAINFPVLLHELSKGIVDFLITHGIPQDLSEEEYIYYYSKSDRYVDEVWHYYFGPTLWVKLLDVVDMTPEELPSVISKMAQLEYDQLASLCNLIVYDTKGAKEMMSVLDIL